MSAKGPVGWTDLARDDLDRELLVHAIDGEIQQIIGQAGTNSDDLRRLRELRQRLVSEQGPATWIRVIQDPADRRVLGRAVLHQLQADARTPVENRAEGTVRTRVRTLWERLTN